MVMADWRTATGSRRVKAMVASGKVESSGPSCSRCWGVLSTHRFGPRRWLSTWSSRRRKRVVAPLVEAQVVVPP